MYLNQYKFEFSKDPRQFYNFVNAKRKSSALPSSVRLNSIEASADPEIADLFAEFFQSTYNSVSWSNSSYPIHLNRANGIFSPVITESSLLGVLETITPTYSPGPDGLPGCVLKFCARTICKPILKLFNLSISSSVFPTIWKDSFIIPLHKKGAKVNVQNYRGISKLSVIPKTFERIITSQLQHLCSSLMLSVDRPPLTCSN